MKTMTKQEFYEELERERKGSVRVVAVGAIVLIVALVAVLLLLSQGKQEQKRNYVETLMIA